MTRRYSKRTRERAALICQIAASNPELPCGVASAAYHLGLLDHESRAMFDGSELISAAFRAAADATRNEYGTQDWVAQIAEAECLIREGWPEVRRGR